VDGDARADGRTSLPSSARGAATGQVLIGFAADHGETGLARAREKLEAKRSDLIVFNDVSREDIGFDAPENEVVLVSAAGSGESGRPPKERIASEILDEIVKLVPK